MNDTIATAIAEINEEIADLKTQVDFLQTLVEKEPLTEEEWHLVCETPLRSTNLMATFAHNIFPEATDIKVGCNYVTLNLFGFRVMIPTSREQGVCIETNWYHQSSWRNCTFEEYLNDRECRAYRYFTAVDNHADWRTLAELRLNRKGWTLPFAWFMWYKWKNPHRAEWEQRLSEKRGAYDAMVVKQEQSKQEMHDKAIRMRDELLPVLNKFSTIHRQSNSSQYSPSEILHMEGLMILDDD